MKFISLILKNALRELIGQYRIKKLISGGFHGFLGLKNVTIRRKYAVLPSELEKGISFLTFQYTNTN